MNIAGIVHYFSKAARDERTRQRKHYERAVDVLAVQAEQTLSGIGGNKHLARELAEATLDGTIAAVMPHLTAAGQTQNEARRTVIDAIIQDEGKSPKAAVIALISKVRKEKARTAPDVNRQQLQPPL